MLTQYTGSAFQETYSSIKQLFVNTKLQILNSLLLKMELIQKWISTVFVCLPVYFRFSRENFVFSLFFREARLFASVGDKDCHTLSVSEQTLPCEVVSGIRRISDDNSSCRKLSQMTF